MLAVVFGRGDQSTAIEGSIQSARAKRAQEPFRMPPRRGFSELRKREYPRNVGFRLRTEITDRLLAGTVRGQSMEFGQKGCTGLRAPLLE